MHVNPAHVEAHINRFMDERLLPNLHRDHRRLAVEAWEVPDEPVPFAEAVEQDYRPFAIGQTWSKPWGTTWFHVTGDVPGDIPLEDGDEFEVLIDLGFLGHGPGFQAEATVYASDGRIIKAVEPRNSWVPVSATPGERVDLWVEAASNPAFDRDWYSPDWNGDKETASSEPLYALRQVDVAVRNAAVHQLFYDMLALRGLMEQLTDEEPRRHEIRQALCDVVDLVDPDDVVATVAAGRERLRPVLDSPAHASAHRVHAVGHAHIDSAWLWPTRETIRKCARTFSNVVDLMDHDPEFTFACSSAQQYAWVADHYPELFERIKQKVAEGRFVPTGGMWVESDTNMPGGEALARQFVEGTNYFMDAFGFEPRDVWLPDSFGYTGAMPQIARRAGKEFFLTQKCSWNDTNTMPHHSFWWEGIDGSRVFTHFPPADTYNSDVGAGDLFRAQRQYAEKGRANTSLLLFGFGDGGGGPTREMLAQAHRSENLEGSPTVRLSTPETFFEVAREEYPDAPVWSGEMYLEFHRGTYTSQHRTKAGNRRSEHLLREAELWCATAAVRCGSEYPAADLQRLWRLVLLQQFHDILPGSSIAWVHREAERNYEAIAEELEGIIGRAQGALAGDGEERLVFNAAPRARHGVPGLGAVVVGPMSAPEVSSTGDGWRLSNSAVSVEVDARGLVTSIVRDWREVVPEGEVAGRLQLFRDIPNRWEAWDIDRYYQHVWTDLDEATSIEPFEDDGVVGLEIVREFGSSRIVERIGLEGDSPAIEFDLNVDWHERQKLLKLAFPLDVHAREALSEIQFGHLARPTHQNTSWDAARFETVAHRWVHVGEPGFGVALANDATYGYDITRSTRDDGGTTTLVRASVLRAPRFPDPEADQGRHRLRYALVPGADIADAVRAGYEINLPERVVPGAGSVEPLVRVDGAGVEVEAVKLAQDGSGDVIVRLYESLGGRTSALVSGDFPYSRVVETDLLERGESDAQLEGDSVCVELRPFQIVTLRFMR